MTYRKLIVLAWMLCFLALVPFKAVRATEQSEALVLVVGNTFPVDDISFAALRSSYRAQRIKFGGQTVIPINHPLDSSTRVAFDRIVLGLEPAAVGPFWIDMRIRDQGRPPTTASTPELALRIVAALKGSITYATPSTALQRLPVKVLTIENKSVGQPGYLLTR